MQFTPQQLAGASRYGSATRIGNWNEDLILEEYRMKEYRLNKEKGKLINVNYRKKLDILNQIVPHSYHSDSFIQYYDYIQINHLESGGIISCDIFEETFTGSKEYITSVSSTNDSMKHAFARNTFKIIPSNNNHNHNNNKDDTNNRLKYGEPFRIQCNESLLIHDNEPFLKPYLYLKSCLKNERQVSPISFNQLVSLTSNKNDVNTLWYTVKANVAGSEKFLTNGSFIHTNDKITIIHQMTGQAMYSSKKNIFPTIYGNDYELCCLLTKLPGKHHNLNHEKVGERTGETLGKIAVPENTWSFLLGTNNNVSMDNRKIPPIATVDNIIEYIRNFLKNIKYNGFRGLVYSLKLIQNKNNIHNNIKDIIEREDLKWGIKHYGLNELSDELSDELFDIVLDTLDNEKNGFIKLNDFINTIRGDINIRYIHLINNIYDKLEKKYNNGKIILSTLMNDYNVSNDPRFINKSMTSKDIKHEFQTLWCSKNNDLVITKGDFLSYFKDISVSYEDENEFINMMDHAWDI